MTPEKVFFNLSAKVALTFSWTFSIFGLSLEISCRIFDVIFWLYDNYIVFHKRKKQRKWHYWVSNTRDYKFRYTFLEAVKPCCSWNRFNARIDIEIGNLKWIGIQKLKLKSKFFIDKLQFENEIVRSLIHVSEESFMFIKIYII